MIVTVEKIILQELISRKISTEDFYYNVLCDIGDYKADYDSYVAATPIKCEEGLKRLPIEDYDL